MEVQIKIQVSKGDANTGIKGRYKYKYQKEVQI